MLNKIDIEKNMKKKLMSPVPVSVVKEKPGKNKFLYVSGQTVIDRLNDTFGYTGWSWEIKSQWVEESVDKVVKFTYKNNVSVKLNKEDWIYEKQLPVCHVIGRLTVYLKNEDGSLFTVYKEAPGAQPIVEGQSQQESCYKGAHTDALKKAATLFGIALDLYRDENEQAYYDAINYENIWTPDVIKEYEEELDFVNKIRESYYKDDEEGFSNYVQSIVGEIQITPDNIAFFKETVSKMLQDSK